MLLKAIIEAETDMTVVGHAGDGREAVRQTRVLKPNLITMDIRMPAMDGFEATRQIMSQHPTPIVVISSNVDDEELRITFRAIEEGALAVIEKPRGIHHPEFNTIRGNLLDTIRAMAEVKLVRRFLSRSAPSPEPRKNWRPAVNKPSDRIVALACSTGGPQALHGILAALPRAFPFPMLVTQHISKGFIGGLADWLDRASPLTVKLAEEGEPLQPGTVYLARDDRHLTVQTGLYDTHHIHLSDAAPINGFRPSATPLFASLAEVAPKRAVGGVLTGMGNDGASGLLAMRQADCHTFVQDQDSSIIFGMPAEALALSAAEIQVPLERIPDHLLSLAPPSGGPPTPPARGPKPDATVPPLSGTETERERRRMETPEKNQVWMHLVAVAIPIILITVSLALSLTRINANIDIIERESRGLPQARQLNRIIINLQKIRGLNQILLQKTDERILAELHRLSGTLNEGFDRFKRDFADDPFAILEPLEKLERNSRRLLVVTDGSFTHQALFTHHTALVDRVRDIRHLVATRSNLILDSHLETYLLIDLVINRLPALMEAIGKTRGVGSGLLTIHNPREIDRFQFGEKLGGMRQNWLEVKRDLRLIRESSPQLIPVFGCFSQKLQQPLGRFAQLSDALLEQRIFGVDARLYFQKGSAAISVISNCLENIQDSLTDILLERHDDLENERLIIVSGLLLALFFMLSIFGSLYRRNHRVLTHLTDSEAKNRAILQSTLDGILTIDTKGIIHTANRSVERIFGYAPGTLIGQSVNMLMPSPDREAHDGYLQKYLKTGVKKIIDSTREVTGVCKDGGQFPLELSVSAFKMGEETFFTGVLHDITERKKAKEALHAAYDELERRVQERTSELESVNKRLIGEVKERSRAESSLRLAAKVFENASEAIVITDTEGIIIDVNRAFTEITLFEREEAIGNTPRIGKSGRHGDAFYENMWKTILSEGQWSGEIWDRRKNGEIFPKWLTINAVRDTDGTLTNFVGIFTDISHIKATEKRLEQLAFYDPLTELPNRMLFRDRLTQEFQAAKRHKKRVAVFFIDLDRFKHVNDTLGHAAGDQLLVEISKRLKSCIRTSDTVARLGGDEFTIILTDIESGRDAAPIARKIIQALQESVQLGENRAHVGASIGIGIHPEDGEDFDTITKHADVAMYHAKASGRGNFKFFKAEMNAKSANRVTLENEMRTALETGRFIVHFQPKINLRSGRVRSMESLVRWKKPDGSLVPPGQFIPLAEETGLIVPMGEQILRMACQQNKQWLDDGMPPMRVGVNLSARQFQQKNLHRMVENILSETGLPPQYLELEVTESMMMDDQQKAITTLNRLRDIGLSISMDDFGTGYSSLSYLKRFPIHALKIDQSFVRDLTVDSDDAAIISAIISMARKLNLHVVAEGVETREQLQFLREEECHELQGYFFSPPIPAEKFFDFVKGDPCLIKNE